MRRRDFITMLGGAATWPLDARAQQPERMRQIGVLMSLAADDPEGQARRAAFLQGLQELGWSEGRNFRIDYRWGTGNADDNRKHAAELVALAPDVIMVSGTAAWGHYCGRRALKDAAGIDADLTERVHKGGPVAHKQAGFDHLARHIAPRYPVAHRQRGNLHPPASEKDITGDEKSIGPFTHKSSESRVDLIGGAGVEEKHFQP
jgi:hypothetical protein